MSPDGATRTLRDYANGKHLSARDGDSGSWVVNPVSMEVYGHLVATDAMGDAYVLPLHSTFVEMQQQLAVDSVSLPTTGDLLEFVLRTAALAKQEPQQILSSSRERRVSEVLASYERLYGGYAAPSRPSDCDSGYGSVDSLRFACYDEDNWDDVPCSGW